MQRADMLVFVSTVFYTFQTTPVPVLDRHWSVVICLYQTHLLSVLPVPCVMRSPVITLLGSGHKPGER